MIESTNYLNVKLDENETLDIVNFKKFLVEFKKLGLDKDLYFINENKICDIPNEIIVALNDCILDVKIKHNIPIYDILTQLSIHVLEPSKIKSLISDIVKNELINELKEHHPTIRKMYPITDELF